MLNIADIGSSRASWWKR